MKNNTSQVKEELSKILRQIPKDFALFEVRRYISLAITKIEAVEKKREGRAIKAEERKENAALKKLKENGGRNE